METTVHSHDIYGSYHNGGYLRKDREIQKKQEHIVMIGKLRRGTQDVKGNGENVKES